jgi:Alginate export
MPAPSRPVLRAAAAATLAGGLLGGGSGQAEQAAPERPEFARLRQDEDWSALCDPARRTEPLDGLKCVPLGADRSAWFSLGGEVRERYEYTHNPLWGEDPQDDHGVFLQRYVLQGDLHLGPQVRLFGQLYSALENGRAGPTSPVDENQLDLQQAFLDLSVPPSEGASATFRLGRQELRYGSGRLVDVREGPNVRRKFDGGRALTEVGDWRIDGLAVRPAEDAPGVFDDGTDETQALWGAYAVERSPGWLPPGFPLDLYYLGYSNDDASYDQGTGEETRQTVGARLWGERAG